MNDTTPCPHCASDRFSPLICGDCGQVFDEPAGGNHFARLGLESAFELDAGLLEKHFIRLSRLVHPDFFAGADPAHQALAARHSIAVNDAYQTLKDTWLRADYLLQLRAPMIQVNRKAVGQDLLMEALELKEELDQYDQEELTGTVQSRLDEIIGEYDARLNALAKEVSNAFQAWKGADDPEGAQCIQSLLNRRKYYRNISDAASAIRNQPVS